MDSKKYIYHITTTTGDTRKSYRHEVDDRVVNLLATWLPELQQGQLRSIFESMYAVRLDTHKRMYAVFTILAVSDDMLTQREIMRFAVSSTGRGAFSAWQAVDGQGNPPFAPFVAAKPLTSIEFDDLLHLPLIADFERCLAWTMLEHGFLKV